MRKICVVTGSRAEYGLLQWLMQEIRDDSQLQLQLAVTGMHLAPAFGLTYRAIEADGFTIDAKVEMLLSGDTATAVTKSMGLGVIGFADAFDRLRPDIVVLLGDRFEILAAAQAALVQGIPIAHLHGGEVTEGAMDESIRHAITKMAQLHFVAAESFRDRVIQMGEPPDRVFLVGATGLDAIARSHLLDRVALEADLDVRLGNPCFLVTYHPETATGRDAAKDVRAILDAIESFGDAHVVFTKPNADPGNSVISQLMEAWAAARPGRASLHVSLGQCRYLSLLREVDLVIGNSSSGIIEAPSLKTPTVNIGDRQKGRPRSKSVIDCPAETVAIRHAIDQVLSPAFKSCLTATPSPYGEAGAAVKIKDVLKRVDLAGIRVKVFHDLARNA